MARCYLDTKAPGESIRSPVKVGLEYGQGPSKTVLAVSGNDECVDSCPGLETPDVDVQPRMCQQRGLWISVERLGYTSSQSEIEGINVEVLSDTPIDIGQWMPGNV